MTVALAFEADDGSRVIESHVEIHEEDGVRADESDFCAYYDISRTVAQLRAGNYLNIALQFPDSLLPDASRVQQELKDGLENRFERLFILGDTSYGSCCVDEVSAQHLFADCIVHYGRTCLSPTSKIPVIYVFGNSPIDIDDCSHQLSASMEAIDSSKTVVLLYEPCYRHVCDTVYAKLQATFDERKLLFGAMKTFYDPKEESNKEGTTAEDKDSRSIYIGGQQIQLSAEEELTPETTTFLYIGTESAHLTSILMRYSSFDCFSYNPKTFTLRKEGATVNRTLMRRFFLVQQAKEAQIIGILMGTLGVSKYLDIVHSLQDLIKKSGRKSYLFVVGKVNVPKLANYAEIDAFVLVACQQNTLIDSKEFYKPIVTPYELQLALSPSEEWTGAYKTDFREVLPALLQTAHELETAQVKGEDDEDADQPYFSLVSGTYKTSARRLAKSDGPLAIEGDGSSMALQVKNVNTDLVAYRSEAAEFLASREYRGLEPRIGETLAHAAVMGSTGIAKGYDHEGDLDRM